MALLTPAVTTSNDHPRRVPRMSADVTELRLALVCDGGVSLAIYIHGVTKELQHVVTASRAVDRVREGDGRDAALKGLTASQLAYFDALEASPTPVTVVIDVISGTSAGGINGVCLAKALSGGLSQDSMTSMWLERADLRELTHPHLPGLWGAILSTAVTFPWHLFTQGWSPLDGDRMCRWLLEALGSMDPTPGGPPTASLLPADHTLDLFVTTTDLRGYQKVFPSPDGGKGEHDRNNRKVFHFTSGAAGPDARFGPGDNPGLAFAARCTSSFPGAFAPVDLAGFAAIAARQGIAFDVAAFIDDHLAEYHLVGDPLTTHFVDGGLLDNSPFDHTISAIAAKSAQGPVDRRIVHIDPDPGDWPATAGDPATAQQTPTWADGVKTALAVQRSQSLVRDLDDLQELNQTIGSVGAITSDLQQRVDTELQSIIGSSGTTPPTPQEIQAWSDAVHARVPAVAGTVNIATYQRLKVAAVADMFGIDLAGVLDYPPGSQPANFLRSVFTAWFSGSDSLPIHTAGGLAELLDDVDLPYRERRFRFLISGVNGLFSRPRAGASAAWLRDLKGRAWAALNALLDFRAAAARSLNGDPVAFLTSSALVDLSPAAFIDAHADDLSDLFTAYRRKLRKYPGGDFGSQLWTIFTAPTSGRDASTRRELSGRYVGFPLWDALVYPVIALSKLPQLTPITLQRISPREAGLLHPVDGPGAPKLRGTAVDHFGGFLHREWRENDYLWGRLDTAEIIMGMIGHPGRNKHSDAAFHAILDAEETNLTATRELITALRHQLSNPDQR